MTKQKSEFYQLDSILKKNATYNMIIGERSNGKTYSVLEKVIHDFIEKGDKFAYVRRWREDVIGRRATEVWNGINENNVVRTASNNEYEGVTYRNGKYFLCNYDDEGKPIYNEELDTLGFTFALSMQEHDKGVTYPNVKTILFDEFMTRGTYLPDEFMLFMNTLSTIIRRADDVTIFMLANTVNKYCPYFTEMGLNHVLDMKQGTIDVYGYGESKMTVAVEYCSSMKKVKKNNFYFAFNNPKLEMITGGAWELDIYPHCPIKYKPKNIDFIYFICFNDFIYQCECVSIDDNYFTFIHEKTTELKDTENDLIYSFDYVPKMNYNRNILKPLNNLQKRLLWYFKTDRVFYADNEIGDSINNYLKVCRKGVM